MHCCRQASTKALIAILRSMSRPAAFQQSMARLALLAMLALALLPGLGRLAQFDPVAADGRISAENDALPRLGAMCTAQGLAYDPAVAAIEAIGFTAQTEDGGRRGAPSPHSGDECDYCTIAASATVQAFLSLSTPPLSRAIALASRRDHVVIWHYPIGLGSRGPPTIA